MSEDCADYGLRVAFSTSFPTDDLPTPAMLDAADLDLVAIFAGDGTVNAALDALTTPAAIDAWRAHYEKRRAGTAAPWGDGPRPAA